MNWYKRYMGDYGRDTADLTMTQDGAYTRLLDRYYTSGQPLPAEKQKLYRIGRAFERWERDAVDSVLAKFFILTSAGYTQKRTEKELAKYKKAADVHTANLANKISPQNGVEKLEARNQIKDKVKNIGAQTAPKRSTAFPDDFVLTGSREQYASVHGVADVPTEFERFREHHISKGNVFRSWDSAWRTWVLRADKFALPVKVQTKSEARIGAGPALPSHPMCESPTCKMCAARRRSRERDLLPVGAGPSANRRSG